MRGFATSKSRLGTADRFSNHFISRPTLVKTTGTYTVDRDRLRSAMPYAATSQTMLLVAVVSLIAINLPLLYITYVSLGSDAHTPPALHE